MLGIRPILLATAGMLLAAVSSCPVWAQIRVEGPADHVRLEARDATVEEILAALGARFDLHYRGTGLDHRVTDTYEGPLRGVLVRVLAGYDYVIKTKGTNLEVLVLDTGSPGGTSSAPIVRRRVD